MHLVRNEKQPNGIHGKLTGRFRFRSTFFGRLVLQVETHFFPTGRGISSTEWRDAKATDLTDVMIAKRLELRVGQEWWKGPSDS